MGPLLSNSTILRPARREKSRPERQSIWARRWVRALIIFAVAGLIRIPFQAIYLVNWDSVNFALGVEAFNLETHQPHPPGYLGYVLLGRLIDWVVGDPVAALTGISVVAGAAATAGVYALATRIVNERAAILAAALFGTSPLAWYYSEVPLTYIVEVALALPLVILILEARARHRESLLLMATVLLAVMGAVRQTSLVLFLPLLIYGARAFSRQVRLRSAALLSVLVLSWLIPLLVLSGGIGNYLLLSKQLAELTGGATWLGAGPGVLQNVIVVSTALALGMHVALLAIPLELFSRRKSSPISAENRRLLLVWGLPPLLTYLTIHSGQLGYVLVLLPIGIIWAAKVFVDHLTIPRWRTAMVGLLVAINGIGFFALPEIAYATVSGGQISFPDQMATNALVRRGIQQVSLPRNDAHWDALLDWVSRYDSEQVAVLAEPRDGGSFRHLSFYLPDTLVYGLGVDRRGSLGHLFTSDRQGTNYSVQRLDEARRTLTFPENVETLLITDPRLQERLQGVLAMDYEMLSNGAVVATAPVPDGDSIYFIGGTGTPALVLSESADGNASVIVSGSSCPGVEDDTTASAASIAKQPITAC